MSLIKTAARGLSSPNLDNPARPPAHQQPHTEECYIVGGTMSFGARDYVAYPARIPHTEVFSPTGGPILSRGCYA